MSSQNSENLILYANSYLYNGSRYVYYQTNRDYDDWLDTQAGNDKIELTVYYKSLTEDLELNYPVADLLKYTYGKLTNDGKDYYIFIDRITTDQHGKSYISFSVDWWATEWVNVHPTKAHLTRKSTKPGYMPQPWTPFKPSIDILDIIKDSNYQNSEDGVIIFSYIDSTNVGSGVGDDLMKFGALKINDFLGIVIVGSWNKMIGIPDTDILGVFMVPIFTYDYLKSGNPGVAWDEVTYTDVMTVKYLTNVEPDPNMVNPSPQKVPKTTIEMSFTSTEEEIQGVVDWYGNSVWECPIGQTLSGNWKVQLEMAPTNILLRFSYDDKIENEIVGKGFTYSCRQAQITIDTGKEYTWRDRTYDIEMRKIQSEKQEWQAVASMFENIGFGMAFGQEKGAVAAGVGGLVEAAATYVINSNFDPQIQQQYDLHYRNMADTISVIGDSVIRLWDNWIQNAFHARCCLKKYKLSMDDDTKLKMITDIQVNGYICDEMTSSLESLFGEGVILQADNIVIEGKTCLDAKQQTVYRLQNGVEFI